MSGNRRQAAQPAQRGIETPENVTLGLPAHFLALAFRVHNGPALYFSIALQELQAAQGQVPPAFRHIHASLQQTIAGTRVALKSARQAIKALQTSPGFPLASLIGVHLQQTVQGLRALTAAEFVLEIDGVEHLPPDIEAGLSVFADEALANAARHADAQSIRLRLWQRRHAVTLEVKDDGKGATWQASSQQGLGLTLMRDQIRILGGSVKIRRSSPGGTLIQAHVRVPVVPRTRRPRTRRPGTRSVSAQSAERETHGHSRAPRR